MDRADPEASLTLALLRDQVADLEPAERERVEAAASQLRTIVDAFGQHGVLALALVGAELQVMVV